MESGNGSHFSEVARPVLTVAGITTLIIMVVGVVGNLLTVVALLRHSKLRTVAAAFIASLCVSDLLFCFLVLPFGASQFFHETWMHGDFLCTVVPVLRYGSGGVSLLSITAISINRYILIAFPGLYQCIYTKTKVACYIGFIWLFSYGVQIPTMLRMYGEYGYDAALRTCSIKEDEQGRSPKILFFVLGFALPCTVIIVCYANIYLVARKSNKTMQKHGTKTRRSEMRITKMVIVIFVCFVGCYLPLTTLKVLHKVYYSSLLTLGYILFYLACCINPVIYVTMNKQYREAYLDTLRCNIRLHFESSGTPNGQMSKTNNMSVSYQRNNISPNPKV